MTFLLDSVRKIREILFEDHPAVTTTDNVGGYTIPIGGRVQRDEIGGGVITGLKRVGRRRRRRKKRS